MASTTHTHTRNGAVWRQLLPTHRLSVVAKTPVLVALGLFLAGGRFVWGTVGWTLVLAAALWGVLYALNEAYDLAYEDGYEVGPSVKTGLLAAAILLCLLSLALSWRLALCFAAMTAGQLAYCAPPVRLKRWWWPILLLGGVANPLLRMESGAIWGAHPVPAIACATLVAAHLGATIRTRVLQRERDRRLAYHVAPASIERMGMVCTALGVIGGAVVCITGILPPILLICAPVVVPFAYHSWSARATSVAELRRAWIWFALGSVFALLVLLGRR